VSARPQRRAVVHEIAVAIAIDEELAQVGRMIGAAVASTRTHDDWVEPTSMLPHRAGRTAPGGNVAVEATR
jgi:hypothetical protein